MRAVNALKDLKYYQQALTHISHSQDSNNERLEFLGDAVLQLVVSEEIYKRFPEFDEGEMSLARANIVNGAPLTMFALANDISPSSNSGKRLYISSETTSCKTASPRNSRRSLLLS